MARGLHTERADVVTVGAGPAGLTAGATVLFTFDRPAAPGHAQAARDARQVCPCGATHCAGILLAQMGVKTVVLDAAAGPTAHPRAHYINNRTMEVFRTLPCGTTAQGAHGGSVEARVQRHVPPLAEWRAFRYVDRLVGGEEYGVVDHFPGAPVAGSTTRCDPHNASRCILGPAPPPVWSLAHRHSATTMRQIAAARCRAGRRRRRGLKRHVVRPPAAAPPAAAAAGRGARAAAVLSALRPPRDRHARGGGRRGGDRRGRWRPCAAQCGLRHRLCAALVPVRCNGAPLVPATFPSTCLRTPRAVSDRHTPRRGSARRRRCGQRRAGAAGHRLAGHQQSAAPHKRPLREQGPRPAAPRAARHAVLCLLRPVHRHPGGAQPAGRCDSACATGGHLLQLSPITKGKHHARARSEAQRRACR